MRHPSTRRSKGPKLFVFGIDGATFDLIEPLMAAGRMPALRRLVGESCSARLSTTWPAHTAPGWASVVTGCTPEHHGIYQFFDPQDPDYGARVLGSRDFLRTTAWDWVASHGWTVGLINVPMSHPPREDVPGYQVTWPLTNTLRYCQPPGLLAELARHEAFPRSDLLTMYRGELGYIRGAIANVRERTRSLRYLMREHPVDVVMFVLTEVDRVCHYYWQFSDPRHRKFVASSSEEHRGAIGAIHEAVDAALAAALELVPDDSTFVVVSDHGSGLGSDALAVNRHLRDAGLLATRPVSDEPAGRLAEWFVEDGMTIDWSRTRAYMPVPGSYAVNLNLRSRQRHGIVDPLETGPWIDRAVSVLSEIRHPTSRDRVFDVVLPRGRDGIDARRTTIPDLILVPRDETVIATPSFAGPLWGVPEQAGLHRHHGIWLQRSPRTRAGRLPRDVRIVDVAPTMLADVGVGVPDDVDGRVVNEAFATVPSVARRVGPATRPPAEPVREEESVALLEMLRAIGYV